MKMLGLGWEAIESAACRMILFILLCLTMTLNMLFKPVFCPLDGGLFGLLFPISVLSLINSCNRPKFSKFVNWVLLHRNNLMEVTSLDLNYEGPINQRFMQNIGDYAVSHNVQKVNIFIYELKGKKGQQIPLCFFSSQSLKHLSVKTDPDIYDIFLLPQSPWDSPALTTIELNDVLLCEQTACLDLFSKCVNLMNLTLRNCYTCESEVVKIACPRLVCLTISQCESVKYEILAPNLSFFCFEGGFLPILSACGLSSLKKVNLHMYTGYSRQFGRAQKFMKMLFELRNARFLTLRGSFIESLIKYLYLQEYQASPFHNLKCLRMEEIEMVGWCPPNKSVLTRKVISYFLNSSPTATVVM